MKLNIGSAAKCYEGYSNLDIRNIPEVNFVCDCRKLCFKDNSIEAIKAFHILEHFPSDETVNILKEWKRVLISGGLIEIQVPDGEAIYAGYRTTREETPENARSWDWVVDKIFGSLKMLKERHGEDYWKFMHKTLFNEECLKKVMKETGFREIQIVPSARETTLEIRCKK